MDASLGSELTPAGIVLLIILSIIAAITSVVRVVAKGKRPGKNKRKHISPNPGMDILISINDTITGIVVSILAALLMILLGPIAVRDFSGAAEYPSPIPDLLPTPTPTQNVDSLTVSSSYEYVSFADANAIIQAKTSAAATRVIMSWSNMDGSSYSRPMRSLDNINWTFFADFYEPGTFIITITAYDANGQTASTIISVPSPIT